MTINLNITVHYIKYAQYLTIVFATIAQLYNKHNIYLKGV